MKFLNRKRFFQALKPKYDAPQGQYFWDAFEGMHSFQLPARTSRRKLEAATRGLAGVFRLKKPVFVFSDKCAGWLSDFGARKRHSPISVAGLEEALALVREHGHFRDRDFDDNYYICDGTFSWFVIFCHENDWHLDVTPQQSRRSRFVAWANENGVRRM